MNSNWKLGLGFSLITALMWGLLPLALKSILHAMDPITITWYRFSVSAAIALIWYGYRRGAALKSMLFGSSALLSVVAVGGLLGNYLLYISGLNYVTPGAAQILIQLASLMLLIGSVLIFKERLSVSQWLGVVILCIGMLLFFHRRLNDFSATSPDYLLGIVLVLAAAIIWSVYGLAQKKLLVKHDSKDIVLLICLAGTFVYLPLAEPQQIVSLSPLELALLVFCGVNTIIAYGCFGLAMTYWEASRVSAVIPIAPLLTLLFTFLLNHFDLAEIPAEPLDWLGYFGALLVVLGAITAAFPIRRRFRIKA